MLPGEFLLQVHSGRAAWLVLTAFKASRGRGEDNLHLESFISVIISAAIASNDNLIRMVETARQQLRQPHMSSRLVLNLLKTWTQPAE